MVAHFDHEDVLDTVTVADKLNRLLPPDISVYRVRQVKPDAHARFDATARTYKYYVTTAKYPFNRQYRYRVYGSLDYERMNEAARTLFEYIDFTSFSKLHTDVKTTSATSPMPNGRRWKAKTPPGYLLSVPTAFSVIWCVPS